jgi:hypothetical protein
MYRLFLIFLIFPALMLYVRCEKNSGPTGSEDETDNTDTMVVRKPNIYLYPENGQELTIRLIFPSGGNVIESVPEYGTGWDIYVDPSGLIDNQYEFLFYEAETPNHYQSSKGWFVAGDTLQTFFEMNMSACGFNQIEIKDFTDYWIPILDPDLDYIIYPQSKKDIDPIITLNFSIEPENILRLFYVIKGHSGNSVKFEEPVIQPFVRVGFTVTEWGIILK